MRMAQKALTDSGGEAAQLRMRLPRDMDAELRKAATRRGRSVSAVVREAINRMLGELETAPPPR